jgi:hypothetical protein
LPYFVAFAGSVRKVASMPAMVTGGFRSNAGMVEAQEGGAPEASLNVFHILPWNYMQIERLADGLDPDLSLTGEAAMAAFARLEGRNMSALLTIGGAVPRDVRRRDRSRFTRGAGTMEDLMDGIRSEDFAERVRIDQSTLLSEMKSQYDFIICGSGSSGSVVARRLASILNVYRGSKTGAARPTRPRRGVGGPIFVQPVCAARVKLTEVRNTAIRPKLRSNPVPTLVPRAAMTRPLYRKELR